MKQLSQKQTSVSVGLRPRWLSAPTYIHRVGPFLPEQEGVAGTMPRATKSPETLPPGRGSRGGRPHPVQLRTYIVEDNATIRENLVDTLHELASVQSLGWSETENEARSWLAAHKGEWDLAIVDLFLKQGSGLGVLEACQARGREQRVVVLSNYATTDMRKRCAQLGADAVFDKSNEIDALVDYCLALVQRPSTA
jgi:two-component system, OmpR family, response regulator